MSHDDVFQNSKSYKVFYKEMSKNKVLRDTLVSFEEILNIKKNIRIMYNTDDPIELKKLIGKTVNSIIVTDKDYDYVILVCNTYNNLYEKCKLLLGNKCDI
ncbi:MAG TPA: hypothetical protein V7791_01575 [Candidatus Azoamicus sp. OHIO1]